VGHGDALVALDWSPGVAWVADDGGQEMRRRSGEGRWSEQEKMSKMCVCNARTSVLGAPGCARDLEQDVVAWKQELARRRRMAARRSSGSNRDSVSCVEEGSGEE
jgi:hypothetical protein